jgi:cell division septation protein DedD
MEEQTSWKSHTFTLLVFTGIVVLCSIFFSLGMLVGRTQGQKLAVAASASAAARAASKAGPKEENRPDLTFYDSVKQSESSSLDFPPSAKSEPAAPAQRKAAEAEPLPAAPEAAPRGAENIPNYQIGAVRKSADANKLLGEVKKKGFKAFILAPSADDANPFFRVQVGPFADMIEADQAKKKLESEGYQPILKK